MYPDQRVAQLILDEFIPVRAHIKEQPTMWPRFGTRWTPTVLVLDPRGREQHRVEGFLPAEEFIPQLHHALGYVAVSLKDFGRAEKHFARVVDEFPDSELGPAALYWKGVARYSASHDAKELQALYRAFQTRYADTAWAKRTIVWKPAASKEAAA